MKLPMTPPDGPTLTDAALISAICHPQPQRDPFYAYLEDGLTEYTSQILKRTGHRPR